MLMDRFILYTYKNTYEFNRFYEQEEKNGYAIQPFIFQVTKELLENDSNNIIDISSLVEYLNKNTSDILASINNFTYLDDDTKIIVKENLSDKALELFYTIFDRKTSIYTEESITEVEMEEVIEGITTWKRKTLYFYNTTEFTQLVQYSNEHEIPIINFSKTDNLINQRIEELSKQGKYVYIDITSLVLAIRDNLNLIYIAEQFFSLKVNYIAIIDREYTEAALNYFKLNFGETEHISNIIPLTLLEEPHMEVKISKITDLKDAELIELNSYLSSKLFGHAYFKLRFSTSIKNFIYLNKLKMKKVFSVFLLGPSGVGKTEFATLLKNYLNPNTSLVKINFGNYSSQDSLNSLIGSPRGYIGSDTGELSSKLSKSKVGVIVCDEFEKANSQIFNFFLELLEDGKFTDTLSREHDVDGYIIIFTSNLDINQLTTVIPDELLSRFDLVCEFDLLTDTEKREFTNSIIQDLLAKIKQDDNIKVNISEEELNKIRNIAVSTLDNLRDIRRLVIDKVLERVVFSI